MNKDAKPRVLITGGLGYIGSHCVRKLDALGYEIGIIDNKSTGNTNVLTLVDGVFYKHCDIRDGTAVIEVIRQFQPSTIIHLAGKAYVEESFRCPFEYYSHNVVGSLRLIEAAVHCGIKRFIFSSSCSVYGTTTDNPVTEITKTNPISPYAHTKLVVEDFLKYIARTNNISVAVLRYFNVAGASDDLLTGEDHTPETHLIPLVIRSALNPSNTQIKVFGTDHITKDGTCERDYLHIEDLSEAHAKAVEYLDTKPQGSSFDIFNLGHGRPYSVTEIIRIAENITGCKVNSVPSERRQGDPGSIYSDTTRAKQTLNWAPVRSIESIIKSAYLYEKQKSH
jgi:UDP-glucose 4-epimerase